MIHEKNQTSKILCYCPFNLELCEWKSFGLAFHMYVYTRTYTFCTYIQHTYRVCSKQVCLPVTGGGGDMNSRYIATPQANNMLNYPLHVSSLLTFYYSSFATYVFRPGYHGGPKIGLPFWTKTILMILKREKNFVFS